MGAKKHKKKNREEDLPVPLAPESPAPEDYASDDGMPVADDDDGE